MRKITKIAAIVSVAGMLQLGGCSWDSFTRNVWRGFGYSVGGLPAGILNNFLGDLLAGLGIDLNGNNAN